MRLKLQNCKITKLQEGLLLLFLFLLPWQTRWIVERGELLGGSWEYGTLAIYATEVLLWVIVALSLPRLIRSFPPSLKLRRTSARIRDYWIWVLAALVGFSFFSVVWAGQPLVAVFAALHLLGALFLVLIIRGSHVPVPKLAGAFIAGVVIQALIGIVQFVFQWIPASTILGMALHDPSALGTFVIEAGGGRILRAYGSLPHPNILGGYIMAALLLLLPFITHVGRGFIPRHSKMAAYKMPPYINVVIWVTEIILVVGLLLTFSRSAWAGAVIGFVFFFAWVMRRARRAPKIKLFYGILIFVITASVITALAPDLMRARFVAETRLEQISLEERKSAVNDWKKVILSSKWYGTGTGNYTNALASAIPDRESWEYQPVHNIPMLIFAELGIPGALLALVFLILFLQKTLRAVRREHKPFFFATIGILLGLGLISLFDHYLWTLYPGLMLAGLTIGLWTHASKV